MPLYDRSIRHAIVYRAGVCAFDEDTADRWVTWMLSSDGQHTVTATPTFFMDSFCTTPVPGQPISDPELWHLGCQGQDGTNISVSNFQPELKLNAIIFE